MININVNKHPIIITTDKFKVTVTSTNVIVIEKKVRKVSTDTIPMTVIKSELVKYDTSVSNKLTLNNIPDAFTKKDLATISNNNKLGLKPTQVRAYIASWVRLGKLVKITDANGQVSYKKIVEKVL